MSAYVSTRGKSYKKFTKGSRGTTVGTMRARSSIANKKDVAKLIKQVMGRSTEKKLWQNTSITRDLQPFSVGALFTDNVFEMGPSSVNSLNQGVGSSDRIGNKIRVLKATLRVILYPLPYDVEGSFQNPAPKPQDVRLMIVHSKNNPTDVVVSSTFFEQNNGTGSPGDDLTDMLLPVNRDIYVTTLDKRCKLGNALNAGSGNSAINQSFANNDYKYNQLLTYDVTSSFPSNITWNDTSTTPTSYQPTLVVLAVNANGTTKPSNEVTSSMWVNLQLEYSDA